MAYFVRIKSRVFGPFDETQLLDMKSKGKITRSTEVSENKSDWQVAESFPFLYEVSLSAPQQSGNDSADWFYSLNGTEGYGPVTASAIDQMLQSGQLNVNSYVWQQGQNARLIKNEPRFNAPASGGISMGSAPVVNTGNSGNAGNAGSVNNMGVATSLGGEITGTSEQVNTGQMLLPIAASLGWLMFLKITWLLIAVIAYGLFLLWGASFSIPHALAADEAMVLLVVLLMLVLETGLYALRFYTFLCFWKYHTVLNQVVATGRAADLIQANQRQCQFWKWLGITVIAHLSVILIVATVTVANAGWVAGHIRSLF